MQDERKTKKQLIEELRETRRELEALRRSPDNNPLLSSRSKIQQILDIADMIFTVVDPDQRLVMINKKGCEVLGYNVEEVVNKNWFELFLPRDKREEARREFSQIVSGKTRASRYMETPILTKRGHLRIITWHSIAITDENGKVTGVFNSGEDITEQEFVQDVLLTLQKAIETIRLGVTITDPEGRIIFTNPAEAIMHGYSPEELIGRDLGVFAPTRMRHPVAIKQIRKWQGKVRESINIRKDGSTFPVRLVSDIVKSANGDPMAIVTVCEDISQQKQTEEELRRYQKNLESMVKERTEELARKVQERNRAKEDLSTSLRYEIGLALCSKVLLTDQPDALPKALHHLLQGGDVSHIFLFQSGENEAGDPCLLLRHHVQAQALPPLKNGRLQASIPFAPDLERWLTTLSEGRPLLGPLEKFPAGERKFLKQYGAKSVLILPVMVRDTLWGCIAFTENIKQRDWIKELVLMQTAAEMVGFHIEHKHNEDQLRTAKEAAEKANELKTQFVFNISHEIRTPLNCIIGFSEIILNSREIEQVHLQARTILQQSDTLLLLINDLLDHAKLESGKLELEEKPFNLRQLLQSLESMVRFRAQKKGLDFRTRFPSHIPACYSGDALRLRQVLTNLADNAIKFTEQGFVGISVEELGRQDDRYLLRFSVSDSGIGIPREKQEYIFQSFTQMDGSVTRRFGGTGLGTTIIRQLLRMMDSEIRLDSSPGEGSRFWFDLALLPAEDIDTAQTFPAEETGENADEEPASGRILVADDYEPNQIMTKLHLESAGYTVDVVENGEEAVKAADRTAYDLILLDVQMPTMDGYQATRTIRSSSELNRETKILAITAYADPLARATCLEAGMEDVITKPLRRKTFLATIRRWCTDKRTTATTEPAPATTAPGDQPIDMETVLYEFGDRDAVRQVLQRFTENVERQLELMEQALANQDRDSLERDAHSMKGGAATLEARSLQQAAAALEEGARDKDFQELSLLLQAVATQYKRLKNHLATLTIFDE